MDGIHLISWCYWRKERSYKNGDFKRVFICIQWQSKRQKYSLSFPGLQMGGTTFDIGTFNRGTVKNVAYKELSTGNTNTFKVRINCK
jgi:hypothetical protein